MKMPEPIRRMGAESTTLHQNWNNQRVTAVVGGKVCKCRSKGEYNTAVYLEFLKEQGEVVEWVHECRDEDHPMCCQFYFKGVKQNPIGWLIDFAVQMPDDEIVYWEYKGRLTGKDVSKFQRMGKFYPEKKVILLMGQKNRKDFKRLSYIRKYAFRILYASEVFKAVRGIVGFI